MSVKNDLYGAALDAYAVWRDAARSPSERCAGLRDSFAAAAAASREWLSVARLSTFGRIAHESAKTEIAVETAIRLNELLSKDAAPPNEPFFPIDPRYDLHVPANSRQWLVASALQAIEEWRVPSGYYLPLKAQRLDILDWLQATPFASAAIERRRQLMRICAGLQERRMPMPRLTRVTPDNLNPGLWYGG